MANEAPRNPKHPTGSAANPPLTAANSPTGCADCGTPLVTLSFDMRGVVVCERCAALRACGTVLDPDASTRELQQSSFVLSLAAELLRDDRLLRFAGIVRRTVAAKEAP